MPPQELMDIQVYEMKDPPVVCFNDEELDSMEAGMDEQPEGDVDSDDCQLGEGGAVVAEEAAPAQSHVPEVADPSSSDSSSTSSSSSD
jgi:hypothetical protein